MMTRKLWYGQGRSQLTIYMFIYHPNEVSHVCLQVRWENGKRGDSSFDADGKYEVVLRYFFVFITDMRYSIHK